MDPAVFIRKMNKIAKAAAFNARKMKPATGFLLEQLQYSCSNTILQKP
jgi:hypothetical protein